MKFFGLEWTPSTSTSPSVSKTAVLVCILLIQLFTVFKHLKQYIDKNAYFSEVLLGRKLVKTTSSDFTDSQVFQSIERFEDGKILQPQFQETSSLSISLAGKKPVADKKPAEKPKPKAKAGETSESLDRKGKVLRVTVTKKEGLAIKPYQDLNLNLEYKLGSGGFCQVYRSHIKDKDMAVRIASRKQHNNFNFFINGYENYLKFSKMGLSPGVYEYFTIVGEEYPGFIMDLMIGDLHFLKKKSFEERKKAAFDLIDIVLKMQNMGYFHGDIKPGNILVDNQMRIYLSDLDSIAYMGSSQPVSRIAGGTRGYRDMMLMTHRNELKARKKKIEYPSKLLREADTFSTAITIFFLLFERSLSGLVLNGMNCRGGDYSEFRSDFSNTVLNNYDFFLNEFINRVLLGPFNPQQMDDPFATFFIEGIRSVKSLENLRSNLEPITAKVVEKWTDIFWKLKYKKIELNCKPLLYAYSKTDQKSALL